MKKKLFILFFISMAGIVFYMSCNSEPIEIKEPIISLTGAPIGCKCAVSCGDNKYCCADGGWKTECKNSKCPKVDPPQKCDE